MEKRDKIQVFTKDKSRLTNLMVFFDKINDLDKGDVIDHMSGLQWNNKGMRSRWGIFSRAGEIGAHHKSEKGKRSRVEGRWQRVTLKTDGRKLPVQFFEENLDVYLNRFKNNTFFLSIPVKSGDNTKLEKNVHAEEKWEIKGEWSGLLGWSFLRSYNLKC